MPDWRADLRGRLARLHFSPSREAEVVEELSQHLDQRWRDLVAGGVAPDEASRRLRAEIAGDDLLARRLGGLRQAHRTDPVVPGAPNRGRLVSDLWQDLRYGARALADRPGFAAAAILTLALGIGANTAIFSVVNATLLRRAPVADPGGLIYVYNGGRGGVFSYPTYAAVRDRNAELSGLMAWGGIAASLNVGGQVDLVEGAIVTGNYFPVLGITPALGRVLQPTDDETPMAHPVAVISHRLWQNRFGSRPDVVGQSVLLNGQPFSIVGVLGPEFGDVRVGTIRDVFVPMMMQPLMRPPSGGYSGEMNPDLLHDPRSWLFAMGRVKPGVSFERAGTALSAVAADIVRERQTAAPRPGTGPPTFVTIAPFVDGDPGLNAELMPVAWLLHGIVAAILLIGCANVANLLLSLAAARRREIALRLALGASRWRLVRQLLTESTLLASLGGLAGVGLAWGLVRSFAAAISGRLPLSLDFTMDGRVLLFALAVSMGTGLVFGLVPALSGSRPALVPALKDGAGATAGQRPARFSLKRGLVVSQVVVSLVLLVTAGLLVRSLSALQAVNPGVDIDRLITAPLSINLLRYTRTQGREFYQRTIDEVSHLPGVESAALARVQVLGGSRRMLRPQVEGQAATGDSSRIEGGGTVERGNGFTPVNVVSPGFFGTLGIAFVRGRDFSTLDVDTGPRVAVVNETFAAMWFPGEDAMGRRLSFNGPTGPWVSIVGVVKNSVYASLNEGSLPVAYLPLSQNHETGMTLYVRASGPMAPLIAPVRRTIQALEPNLPLPDVRPMTETTGTSRLIARTATVFIAGFGALALMLAAVGLYGVLAFSMTVRRQEFGVRMALGATRGNVFRLVVREGMGMVALGVALGLTAAWSGTRLLRTLLFGVSPTDIQTFIAVPLILSAVALLACAIPARRATRTDPITVLREP